MGRHLWTTPKAKKCLFVSPTFALTFLLQVTVSLCHRFRLTKRDDYFLVNFDTLLKQVVFFETAGTAQNWLESKTKPP